MQKPRFIKSYAATTATAETRTQIMSLLERYGGTGFGYETRDSDIVVTFTVPGAIGKPLRVAYPVNIARVQERLGPLYKQMKKGPPTREQAERVAWRNIYELVDAAFAAAAIGASTVEETFHAHLIIETADGSQGRLYDYVESLRGASGGSLPSLQDATRLLSSSNK